jgi:hypothetical protein
MEVISVVEVGGVTGFEVELDETSGEANGAAYLVHMLLTQQAEADLSGRFAREARRLKPVKLSLRDTGEDCSVAAFPGGLLIADYSEGRYATSIRAESRHVIDVTQVRLAGRALITGPLGDRRFWGLLRDIAVRRVVIKGLVSHYANTMRFLWLVNVRR